ncbi:MAG: tetratricopeptide repeat protein, partial [Desulforhopalus sp.]
SLLFRLKKEQCLLHYYNGNYRQVLESTQQLLDEVDFDAELLTLRQIIESNSGKKGGDRLITSRLNIDGQPVISRLIAVAEKEIEYKAYDAAEKHLKTVIDVFPRSTVTNALQAKSMFEQGLLGKADTLYGQLAESFPRENYFVRKMIDIAVRQGRYDQALTLLGRAGVSPDKQTPENASQPKEDTIEEQLLLARLLWGDKQQDKSLRVYKELLDPPVVDLLVEQFRKKQINYTDLTREHTFWSSTLLLLQSEPEIIGELMEPDFLIKNRGSEAGKLVAQYFDLYSWQRLITTEYMARTATYNRNYRYAEQSYKRLLEEEDSTEGMLDLATIYSRTGEYRKEAQVYEVIQDSGTSTPQLENSIERTAFQLSPQSSIDGSYFEMSGRDDYINIKKSSVGTSFWFTPALDRDVSFLYANNRYESVHGNAKTGSNAIFGGATIDFAKRYELKFGGGMEILNGEGDTEFLYDIEVNGQLDDYVDGYLLFEKKPVYDTVAAIQDHIIFYAIATGLNCETSRGIAFGGGVRHRNFSDGNAQNQFNAYSSYTIFGESLQLALRYDYLYMQSDDGNDPEVISIVEPLYWSPAFYYEHQLSVRFQHDFLGYEQGAKQGVSYYALDGAVGYEDDQTVSFTGLFDIFLEISPHFLLKGNFTLSNSDQYEETGLSLSLHYRW